MRVDRCDWSGFKVYPSRGKVYVRGDSKVRIDHKAKKGRNRIVDNWESGMARTGSGRRHGEAQIIGMRDAEG